MIKHLALVSLLVSFVNIGSAGAQTAQELKEITAQASAIFNARICDFVNDQSVCIWEKSWVTAVDFNRDGLLDFVLQIPPAPRELLGGHSVKVPNYPPPQTRVYCARREEGDVRECFKGPYAHISFQRVVPAGPLWGRGALKMIQRVVKDECTAEVSEFQWDKGEFILSSMYEMSDLSDSCVGPYAPTKKKSTAAETRMCDPRVDDECGC